jgi:hypothetical protein
VCVFCNVKVHFAGPQLKLERKNCYTEFNLRTRKRKLGLRGVGKKFSYFAGRNLSQSRKSFCALSAATTRCSLFFFGVRDVFFVMSFECSFFLGGGDDVDCTERDGKFHSRQLSTARISQANGKIFTSFHVVSP